MNEPLKYVVVVDGGVEVPIVFNSILTHMHVAFAYKNIVSAGFCIMSDPINNHVSAWGESISLDVKSRGDIDADIIYQSFKP